MITELFVENYPVDISAEIDALMTYCIDDIKDFSSRNTSFSKTIVIPGTAKNNLAFGNIFDVSSAMITSDAQPNIGANYNIAKAAKCIMFQGNLQIFKGIIRILKIVIDRNHIEYECAVFGELGGFISALGIKRLQDLDFSEYDHVLNMTNIENSWNTFLPYSFEESRVFPYPVNQQYNTTFNHTEDKIYLLVPLDLSIFQPGKSITISNCDDNLNEGTYTIESIETVQIPSNVAGVESPFYRSIIKTVENIAVNNTTQFDLTIDVQRGSGYYYPLIDYGKASTDKHDYAYTTFRPALFLREYMDKIITGSNYTYECDFFDSNFFKRIVIPHNKNILEKNEQVSLQGDFDAFFEPAFPGSTNITPYDLTIDDTVINGFSTADNITYTYNGTISSTLTFKLTGSMIMYMFGTIYPNIKNTTTLLTVYKNGNRVQDVFLRVVPSRTAVYYDTYTFNVTLTIPVATGDTIKFGGFTQHVRELTFTNTTLSVLSNEVVPLLVEIGDTVKINENLPQNILQKDFFSSVVKLFNLMIVEDKDKTNHLIIKPYLDFYDTDIENTLDWTYKLDRNKPMMITPMSEANARFYNIKFKGDSDFYNDKYKKKYNTGYGDVIFDNALDFAKESITKELIFSSSPLVGYPEEDKIVCPIFKWDGTTPDKEESIGSNIRLMQVQLIPEVTEWSILDEVGGTALASFESYPYAGHFDDPDAPASDINMDVTKELYYTLTEGILTNNLFNTYWLPYMYEIIDKDSRLLTATFRLNEQDINLLDFSKLIFIDGQLYRLNKISDYNASERDVCKVELLKVMQLTYTEAVGFNCIADEENECVQTELSDPLLVE